MPDTPLSHGILAALTALAVPIDDVRLNPTNTRRHEKRSLDALKVSLAKYGQRKPIVVQRSGMLVRAGNGMLAAARELGWTHIAAVVVDESNVDATAYEIMDNRSAELSSWEGEALKLQIDALREDDIDLALTGFDSADLDQILGDLTGKQTTEDTPPEPPPVAVSQRGDLWLCGSHRVLCGDSTCAEDVARVMGDEKADCVFTSPPYGVGIDYGTYEDTIGNLRAMLPRLARNWLQCVADGGYAVVNFGDIVSASAIAGTEDPCEYPMALEYYPVFRNEGWVLWSRRVWCKPCAGTGSMQCISSNRASTNWEHIWTWKAPGKALHDHQITGEHASQNGWFDSTHDHKLGVPLSVHGAGMPVGVAGFSIAIHSFVGHLVYEPFIGTGTTMVAAEQLGRRCFGIEIEPRYVDAAITRWANLTNAEPTLDGDGRTFSEIAEERGIKAPQAMAEVPA